MWKNKFFGNRDFYGRTLSIAIPIMIQNGITNFVSMLDNIMVGRVGTEQMTGVAIVNQIIFVFNLMIFGVVSGAGIFGAQFYGSGDHKGVRHTFRFRLYSCILVAILAILFFAFAGPGLIMLYLQGEGTPEQIQASLNCATQYLQVMLIGIIPFVISQSYSSTLRETGETMLPMKAGIVAVLVNLSLNAVLIFGLLGAPRMGAIGAAVATVISRFVEAAIMIIITHKRKAAYRFIDGAFASMYVPRDVVHGIIVKGVPLMLNETMWAAGIAILNQCYSIKGYSVVSAVNITSTINNLFNISFIAMGSAIGIIVGQHLGAEENEKAMDATGKLTVFSALLCVGFGAGLFAVAPFFPRIYNTSQQVRDLATHLIMISAMYMPIAAVANSFYFAIRSGGKVWITVLFDSCYVWVVTVPMAFLLSRFTQTPILVLYFLCQFIDIGKCVIGYGVVKSRVWLQKIVA